MKHDYEIPCEKCGAKLKVEWWAVHDFFIREMCECEKKEVKKEE